ncbi:MAG: glycosyltransferase family 2 protein [Actinobacteria bacterium]|nr:glycosyltransferase family 2 protein [Actinomycetota bacterium]
MPTEAESAPLLEIVIVNSTGGRDLLRACLASLELHPLRSGPMRVWVVDNASADGAVEMVRTKFPWVHVEELSYNAGFCVANNVVLRSVESPYVLVLNPDTEMSEGALDHMVRLMEEYPEIGMSGCRLVMRDGTFDHAAKRSFPTPLSALGHFVAVGRSERAPRWLAQYRAPDVDEHDAGPVDSVNGAFMLVRREALRDVGLLDEGYWLYMDDLDWCYRFHRKGWKVWYDGRVTVLHVKGGTTVVERHRRRHRGLRHNVAFHRSMGRFYRKFYGGRRPIFDGAIYLAIGLKLAVAVLRSTVARRRLV